MRRGPLLLAALAGFALAGSSIASDAPLRLGLMPFGPPGALIREFTPLELYLERRLGQDVILASAPDYATFVNRMLVDEYDLVNVAPHFALLAIQRGHWVPLARDTYHIQPTVIVRVDSAAVTLRDLRSRTVALPDRTAMVTMEAERELARAGLNPGKQIAIVYTANHNSAMEMVLRNLAEGAVVSSVMLSRLPDSQQARLRVLHRFPGAFGLAFLASPRLPPDLRERLRTALLELSGSPEGRAYFRTESDVVLKPLTVKDLGAYAPFLPELAKRLAEEPR
jgi:ABC-type phosphate/phosphonate transport system substrate-binding protein